MKHTPTPWHYRAGEILAGTQEVEIAEIKLPTKDVIGPGNDHREMWERQADDNAAFIVRAVNCHEEMLSALRIAQVTIHATWKSLNLPKDGNVAKAFQDISQAIAKAEGK
jgi:hypothetical protein